MILALQDRIKRGNFADIFSPPPGDRALKVFTRITARQLLNAERFIFDAEVGAYEIVSAHPHLARYTPKFFGVVQIDSVTDRRGHNLSYRYCPELCYSMERLAPDPDERKLGMFFGTPEWALIEPIKEAFEAVGIGALADASVLHWRSGEPRLIDFATYEAAAQHWRWE